VLETW